ncbi:MAG: hypothetical protein ACI9CE_002384 [Flavobacterium sp.]|jgi:hypothetical protein
MIGPSILSGLGTHALAQLGVNARCLRIYSLMHFSESIPMPLYSLGPHYRYTDFVNFSASFARHTKRADWQYRHSRWKSLSGIQPQVHFRIRTR